MDGGLERERRPARRLRLSRPKNSSTPPAAQRSPSTLTHSQLPPELPLTVAAGARCTVSTAPSVDVDDNTAAKYERVPSSAAPDGVSYRLAA